jgi:hypothetical protein
MARPGSRAWHRSRPGHRTRPRIRAAIGASIVAGIRSRSATTVTGAAPPAAIGVESGMAVIISAVVHVPHFGAYICREDDRRAYRRHGRDERRREKCPEKEEDRNSRPFRHYALLRQDFFFLAFVSAQERLTPSLTSMCRRCSVEAEHSMNTRPRSIAPSTSASP